MFGNLGGFVNGNMFMGLFGADIGVKLADSDRDRLEAEDGTGPFGPQERPMAGYTMLPASWRTTPKKAKSWIAKSLDQTGALPPKQKPAKPKPANTEPAKKK
jgi:TfoX/Sxy family transcriptional regulator of competence genes